MGVGGLGYTRLRSWELSLRHERAVLAIPGGWEASPRGSLGLPFAWGVVKIEVGGCVTWFGRSR